LICRLDTDAENGADSSRSLSAEWGSRIRRVAS